MKRKIAFILGGLLALTSLTAVASPEQDRKALLKHYKEILPSIKFDDYIYGTLAMTQDAMNQYNSMMEFPSFSMDVDEGHKIWDAPFKNGKNFASCFPKGGKNAAAPYPVFDDAAGK